MNKPSLPDRSVPPIGPDGLWTEAWYRVIQYLYQQASA